MNKQDYFDKVFDEGAECEGCSYATCVREVDREPGARTVTIVSRSCLTEFDIDQCPAVIDRDR